MLAEEFGDSAAASPGYCWVFDPIDGTTNFAHGLPIFCASLALEIDGEAVVGAVYDPTRRELFTAERAAARSSTASRCTCLGADSADRRAALHRVSLRRPRDDRADIIGLFAAFVGRARAVRRLGSAALDLCYVAAGRLDGSGNAPEAVGHRRRRAASSPRRAAA